MGFSYGLIQTLVGSVGFVISAIGLYRTITEKPNAKSLKDSQQKGCCDDQGTVI